MHNFHADREVYAYQFASERFIRQHAATYSEYTALRASGFGPIEAWNATFATYIRSEPHQQAEVTEIIERTRYFLCHYERQRDAMPLESIYNARLALRLISEIAADSRAPAKVRLEAVREMEKIASTLPRPERERMRVAARAEGSAAESSGSVDVSRLLDRIAAGGGTLEGRREPPEAEGS